MIWAHFTRSFRETFPTRASEWALGLMLFLWSVILSANPTLFADSAALAPLADIVSQRTWAVLCLIVGGGRLIMLAINGAWRRSPHLRALAAFVSSFFWFEITVGLLESGTFGTGLAIYPVLLALDIYNVLRAARDAGSADRIQPGARRHGSDS